MTKWCVKSIALSETPFAFATASERFDWNGCAVRLLERGNARQPNLVNFQERNA